MSMAKQSGGIAEAERLLEIVVDQVANLAPAEANELRRIAVRLRYHRQGVAHVEYPDGHPTLWKPEAHPTL